MLRRAGGGVRGLPR